MWSLHFVYCLRDGHVSESWVQVFFFVDAEIEAYGDQATVTSKQFCFWCKLCEDLTGKSFIANIQWHICLEAKQHLKIRWLAKCSMMIDMLNLEDHVKSIQPHAILWQYSVTSDSQWDA